MGPFTTTAHTSTETTSPSPERTEYGMRFAFRTAPQHTTWTDLLSVWRVADDIEVFESGWVFDHFYPIFTDSRGPCLEGWTVLTALAQATKRLRFGTLVTGIHHRHPAVLANMATTLDIVSGGRLELGLGAGWNEEESSAYGLALGTPAQRSDRFEEACEILTSLMSREATTFSGDYYRLTDARNEPKGVQRPHPPICVGGNGEKRTLRTAARFAQHWSFFGGTPQEFAHKRDVLHAHCGELGRDPSEIVLSSPVVYEGDPHATAASAAALAEQGAELAIVVLRPPFDPTVLEPLADALGHTI